MGAAKQLMFDEMKNVCSTCGNNHLTDQQKEDGEINEQYAFDGMTIQCSECHPEFFE